MPQQNELPPVTPGETDALECRLAFDISQTADGKLMYAPAGRHTITVMQGAKKVTKHVLIEPAAVQALEAQRQHILAMGKAPMFDFNHNDDNASFRPTGFVWEEQPAPGIYAIGEWTGRGKEAVQGKEYSHFSPRFHVEEGVTPARVLCRTGDRKPNMGGLVNDPAFNEILPVRAKHAGAASDQQNQNQIENAEHMNEQELAALRAKNQELQNEINALNAKNADAAAIAAKQAEQRAVQAELNAEESRRETEALKAKNAKLEADATARNKADAEAAVKRAVERGAIAAKDQKTQDALVAKATDDPAFSSIIDAMQGNPALGGRITPPNVQIVAEAPSARLKAFYALLCKNAEIKLQGEETAKQKGKLAREAAAIFAKDIEKDTALVDITIDEAIRAADVSETNVGLLAGTLVLQRALPLLQYEFPMLDSITQDFSDAPGLWNQTETTRIVVKPAVQNYDNTLDSAGRHLCHSRACPKKAE